MASELRRADSHRAANLVEKFRNRKYRHSYVVAHTRRFLARQMRKFRGDLSQTEFGDLLGKQQTVVSRLEDPAYGKWTLQTLFEIAEKLDVAVVVRFVDFKDFLTFTSEMDEEHTKPASYASAAMESVGVNDISPQTLARIAAEQTQQFSQNVRQLQQSDRQQEIAPDGIQPNKFPQ